MDVALSKNGARLLRAFFCLVVIFLYAPIVILLIFSFNDSAVPTFPLSGFTFRWYRAFLENADLRSALSGFDIPAIHEEVLASQQERLVVFQALSKGHIYPWDFQPLRAASEQYTRNHRDVTETDILSRFPPAPEAVKKPGR